MADATAAAGLRIRVRGLVQGVGFRPFVWRIAYEEGIRGRVLNDGGGVLIDGFAAAGALARFSARLAAEAPPLSRIESVTSEPLAGIAPEGFSIVQSEGGAVSTGIVPDAAICPACRAEIFDPSNRRYRYPFTNCTHCGPRLSIIERIPYDRAGTSMRAFRMCPSCQAEYDDPSDRRFHAQPNACAQCGPSIWLEDASGKVSVPDTLVGSVERLLAGFIVAIKGIGGFHLACDATDEAPVAALRSRKKRDWKPFAVMVRDMAQARELAEIGEADAALMESAAASVAIVSAKPDRLAAGIAPGHDRIGLMLPYTPLHCLLMEAAGRPLVMTSANISGEPQVTGNAQARRKLHGIADFWLMHDRDIVNRLDDSVVLAAEDGPMVLRRARGMAPEPLPLPDGFGDAPRVLAMGGDLKAAFALLDRGRAILSQHMGDLEDAEAHDDYRRNLDLYRRLFDFTPDVVAVDRHEGYHSARLGRALAAAGQGARLVEAQHHHAHLAACLFENGVAAHGKAVGIILDGTGAGLDGTVWGGEILFGGYRDFRREARFAPVALPGGAQAVREPWRNAAAHLLAAFGMDWRERIAGTAFAERIAAKPAATIERMIARGVNAPLSSSAGRLFDAAAAMLGQAFDRQDYEGQTGMELEALARPFADDEIGYATESAAVAPAEIRWDVMWDAMLRDLRSGVEAGRIAARFHLAIAAAAVAQAAATAARHDCARIALSGGVMQNSLLANAIARRLRKAGFEVLVHRRIPPNDGGLAIGQAAIAALSDELQK